MENNTIYVVSASDSTLVINIPSLPLQRIWKKKNQKYPLDRNQMIQAFYDPSAEFLFREGLLYTDDKKFLLETGLIQDEAEEPEVKPLTDAQMLRLIKNMPISEVKTELSKLTRSQLDELGDYAVVNYEKLSLDRIDILSQATHKDIEKAITHYRKAQQEG